MARATVSPVGAFVAHYLEYLTSSGIILLTLALLLGPLLFSRPQLQRNKPNPFPGCRRAGLWKRSNLTDRPTDPRTLEPSEPRIKALFVYPIKSCRGVELAASEVHRSGLRYDRIFTFAQRVTDKDGKQQWRFITQRECPKLALLETQLWLPATAGRGRRKASLTQASGYLVPPRPRRDTSQLESASPVRGRSSAVRHRGSSESGKRPLLTRSASGASKIEGWKENGGCLVVRFANSSRRSRIGLGERFVELKIPLSPTRERAVAKKYRREDVTVWLDSPRSFNVSSEIPAADLARLRGFLGVKSELAIFRVDESQYRKVTRSLPPDSQDGSDFTVGFTDAFPANLLSIESVASVDSDLPSGSPQKGKLSPLRFRANIYIEGGSAFEEDTWKRIELGKCLKPLREIQPQGFAGEDYNTTDSEARDRVDEPLVVTTGTFHVACRTARCKVPNVDPVTGDRDNNEPFGTLRKHRDVDSGASPHPCLGMQMIPLFQTGAVQVGDVVQVLETGEHVYEKMFK